MATINVKDAAGATVALEKPLAPGRAAEAASRPIALSTEDKTALDALATQTTAAAILAAAGATTGAAVITDANGTIQQYARGLVVRWLDALGAGTAAAALRVTFASDGPGVEALGAPADAAAATDTSTGSLIALAKRLAQNISSLSNSVASGFGAVVLATGSAIIGKFSIVDMDGVDLKFKKTTAVTGQNALSTTAELVIAANANRAVAGITNDDAAIKIFWGTSNAVTTSTGHVIKPGATEIEAFKVYIGDIYIIAASGTPTVTFWEV